MNKEEFKKRLKAYGDDLKLALGGKPRKHYVARYSSVNIRNTKEVRDIINHLNEKHNVVTLPSDWERQHGHATKSQTVRNTDDQLCFADDEQEEGFYAAKARYWYNDKHNYAIPEDELPTPDDLRYKRDDTALKKKYKKYEKNPSLKSLCNQLAQKKGKWGSVGVKHSHNTRILNGYDDYPVTAYALQGRQMVCIMQTARLTLGLEVVAGVDYVESMRIPLAEAIKRIKDWQKQPVYGAYNKEELKELEVQAVAEIL